MTRLTKVTRALDLVNVRKKTMHQEEVTAYAFNVEVKGGSTVELYVYKRENEWDVNETESNARIGLPPRKTRKEAVETARERMKTVSRELIETQAQRIQKLKHGCEVIEEETK